MPESLATESPANPRQQSVLDFANWSQSPSDSVPSNLSTVENESTEQSRYHETYASVRENALDIAVDSTPFPRIKSTDLERYRSYFRILLLHAPSLQVAESIRGKIIPKGLSEALTELRQACVEAEEDGFPIPSDVALSNALRLLTNMYEISPQRLEVYPTPDAEIAIRALAPRKSVIMLCDSLGGALCLVNVKSGRRRKRYTSADALPDSFLEKALLDLKRESI